MDAQPTPVHRTLDISSRGRRLGAYVIEWLAFVVIGGSLHHSSPPAAWLFVLVAGLGSSVVLVARYGCTAGMWVLQMRIQVPPSVDPPGWRVAIIRAAVASWPYLLALVISPFASVLGAAWFGVTANLWFVVCYGAILLDPVNQGIHDRVAGTVVVDVDRKQFR